MNSLTTTEVPNALALFPTAADNEEWVVEINGAAVADSRLVAKVFEKRHHHIVRDINDLTIKLHPIFTAAYEKMTETKFGFSQETPGTTDFEPLSEYQKHLRKFEAPINGQTEFEYADAEVAKLFIPWYYKDASGKSNRMYYLPRNGFNPLVMGYTTQKALIHKLQYIDRYDKMEAYIAQQANPQQLTAAEIATIAAQAAVQAYQALQNTQAVNQSPTLPAAKPQALTLEEAPDLMTVKEAQAILRIGHRQIYTLIHAVGFPIKKVGGSYRVPKAGLVKWIAKN